MKSQSKLEMKRGLRSGLACLLILLTGLASAFAPRVAEAADTNYIVVRLDQVRLLDCGDGNEGEIQYLTIGATGDHGKRPFAVQRTTFPMENWYEGEEDGANATFMQPVDQAVPVFAYPEADMGNELLLVISVADDDQNSDFVVIGHAVLAKVGTAVATYYLGPSGGAAVDKLSGAVQKEIEKGGERDNLGTLSVVLPRNARDGSRFGLPPNENVKTFERQAGKVWIKYTVMRIPRRQEYNNWCVSVTLNKIKIVDDSDDATQGDGDVYVRARVADGYAMGEQVQGEDEASELNQTPTILPRNKYTETVGTGEFFPSRDVKLYANTRGSGRNARCVGLPVFLYIEVDVFEDDSQLDCSGRTCDDVLGVLPLMYTQNWLRQHPGSNQVEYSVRGDSGKARIWLTIDVWNPHADPDQPISKPR